MKTARSAVIEIADGGIYYTLESYHLFVNGIDYKTCDTVITSVFGLKPDTDYRFEIVHEAPGCEEASRNDVLTSAEFRTLPEFVTINVRDLGAKGDGISDDTVAVISCHIAGGIHVVAVPVRKQGEGIGLLAGITLGAKFLHVLHDV